MDCVGPLTPLPLAYYALAHPATTHETKAYAEQLQALVEPHLTPHQLAAATTQAGQTTLENLLAAIAHVAH